MCRARCPAKGGGAGGEIAVDCGGSRPSNAEGAEPAGAQPKEAGQIAVTVDCRESQPSKAEGVEP